MNPQVFLFINSVRLEVYSDDIHVQNFYNDEYRHHISVEVSPSHSVVKLLLNKTNSVNLENAHTYNHKLLARWRYLMDIGSNNITIHAQGNYLATPMIHHMMVHPAIRYLAACKSTLMLHSSAVSCGGKSVIFTGRGGTGKTTTTSLILSDESREWQLHADDYVFISPEPKSQAYITRQHLYSGSTKWIPELIQTLTPIERLGLFVFGNIRLMSKERIKWPMRIAVERSWPQRELCFEATPVGLVLLRGAVKDEPKLRRVHSTDQIVEELLDMNIFEARYFIQLLSKVIPNVEGFVSEWKYKEREILKEIVNNISVYELWRSHVSKNNAELPKQTASLISRILC